MIFELIGSMLVIISILLALHGDYLPATFFVGLGCANFLFRRR